MGQVKVEQHDLAVIGPQDVGSLDVKMNQVPLVGVMQGVG
jgi:hypothetical protein